MESSTAIGSAAEIAARLERATRSVLASSSLASYSYSQASATGGHIPQPPTLEDLLPTLGPPDAVRCPACNTALPFGLRSRICLACTAPLQQFTTPSFTSTLAYRCFSEALHLDGLETNFGEAEEDRSSNTEVEYIGTKSSSSLSSRPLQAGAQIFLQSADIFLDKRKYSQQPEPVKSDAQTPLPGSSERGSKPSAVPPMGLANADREEKRPGILEYSTKLEGISLEDFFSNEIKAQRPPASSSDTISDSFFGGTIIGEMSGISASQDSLFWDPLSKSIIPAGFDLVANSRETSATKDGSCHDVFGEEDNDDPFSSWEGDFQSATPAMPNVIPGSPLSALPITSTKIEDIFGDFPSLSSGGGESLGIQGKNRWVSNGNLFDLDLDVEKTPRTDSEKTNTDVDDFFGSGWQQSMPGAASSAANDSQSLSFTDKQSILLKSRQDPLGIMKEMDTFTVNISLDPGGEGTLTEDLGLGMSVPAGNRNKVVGSLLAQLHDLSFMLADKLVIRSKGKSTQPGSCS